MDRQLPTSDIVYVVGHTCIGCRICWEEPLSHARSTTPFSKHRASIKQY